ncbi:unnamed protein product [Danaus chrysippus]|uniref:(African queen) hypothetical protein n=1 Tax=Danaus chrysippus TaxID=151541 RepID=A0A8J2RAG8_9NEOP|nr:unnamed protein product [Danaus chrysippus]
MGGLLNRLWWGGDPDAVNPVSGLSRRDVFAVQKSWAIVYSNPQANGSELLKRYFRAHPESKEFFRMLRKLNENEFDANHQFKAHVMSLMSSLNLAITNLDQPEVVAAMMNKLGESHGRRKIEEQYFHDLKGVIVKMFIEVLKLDNKTLTSWGKVVDFLYKHIFVTLKPDS